MIQLLCIFCTIYSTPLQESGMYGYRAPLLNKVDLMHDVMKMIMFAPGYISLIKA
jgi:hypothetical protein